MKPNPSSPIDKHRYVVLLRITSASAGGWSPDIRRSGAQPIERRDVRVEATVREILKAPEGHRIARELKLGVTQRQPADGWRAEDYGPWSEVELVAGIELLAFANEPIPEAPIERTLADGCGLLVQVPNPQVPFAVEDVRRALAWEGTAGRHVLESEQTRRAINEGRAACGPLMAGFLVESVASGGFANPVAAQEHKFILELLRAPEVSARFRLVILSHEINELVMAEAPPVWFRVQLIAAMMLILSQEDAKTLHDPIRQTYLVNSVFDAKGLQLVAARDILATDVERTAFGSLLRRRGFEPNQQARLLRWLSPEGKQ